MPQHYSSDLPVRLPSFGTGATPQQTEAPAGEPFARPGGLPAVNALEDVRWVLAEFEDSLRARAMRHLGTGNGTAADHGSDLGLNVDLLTAADQVARCRAELERLQTGMVQRGFAPEGSDLPFSSLRRELLDAGQRTEKIVESVADALDRIDAERCLLAEHHAEQMEAARTLLENWRGEQAGYESQKSAALERLITESTRAAESMRESYTGLGKQMELLQAAAASFGPLFEGAEKRLIGRFDEQQAELARQRGWIDQKLEETRSELDRSRRTDMAHTRSFILMLVVSAALLPVAAVALALFLQPLLRWLNIGS